MALGVFGAQVLRREALELRDQDGHAALEGAQQRDVLVASELVERHRLDAALRECGGEVEGVDVVSDEDYCLLGGRVL